MKKFAVIVALAALFASCKSDDLRMQKQIVDITVQSTHWQRQTDAGGNFIAFFNEIQMPELTRPFFEEGLYVSYYVWMDGNVRVQQPLPHIIFHEDGDGNRWTETISCDYSQGFMQFHVRYSDFFDEERPPTMNFRFIVLM